MKNRIQHLRYQELAARVSSAVWREVENNLWAPVEGNIYSTVSRVLSFDVWESR